MEKIWQSCLLHLNGVLQLYRKKDNPIGKVNALLAMNDMHRTIVNIDINWNYIAKMNSLLNSTYSTHLTDIIKNCKEDFV